MCIISTSSLCLHENLASDNLYKILLYLTNKHNQSNMLSYLYLHLGVEHGIKIYYQHVHTFKFETEHAMSTIGWFGG